MRSEWMRSSIQQTFTQLTLGGFLWQTRGHPTQDAFLLSVGPGVQMPREEAAQTRAAENPHMILKAGVGSCPWYSSLLGTYPWCVATKYLTLNMPLGLAVAGCLHYLVNAGSSLHLPRYLNQSFFPKPGPKQAEASWSTHLSVWCLWDLTPTAPPPSLLLLTTAWNPHHSSSEVKWLGSPGGSADKETTCYAGDLGSVPGLGRSPGEAEGYPLQYSGLENSMDCIVHRVTKSRTQLRNFHFHSPNLGDWKKFSEGAEYKSAVFWR